MADSTPKSYHTDPTLYLYTSLTSGSSHIISATSRMRTILKANRIDFQALDVATDEKARMLWGRRAGKRKLPGLVRFGMIVGDLEEVEEWNEYGELKENVNLPNSTPAAAPSAASTPSKPPVPQAPSQASNAADKAPVTDATSTTDAPLGSTTEARAGPTTPSAVQDPATPATSASTLSMAMRQAGLEAAKKAGDAKTKARQEELERLRAQSTASQKLDTPTPGDIVAPSATTGVENIEKSQDGVKAEADAANEVASTTNEEKGAVPKQTTITEPNSTGKGATPLLKAANEDMAKASNEASTGATEPEVLAGKSQTESKDTGEDITPLMKAANEDMAKASNEASTGATEPEVLPSRNQTEAEEEDSVREPPKTQPILLGDQGEQQPAKGPESQHVLSAKEAEQEANKAIVADESTHVHIAGSPPPHASPGMKYPRDDNNEDVESPVPPSQALKEEVKSKSKETGTPSKVEDDAGRVDNLQTTTKDEDSDGVSVEPDEKSETRGDAIKTSTEQSKLESDTKEAIETDSKTEVEAPEEAPAAKKSNSVEETTPKVDTSKSKDTKSESVVEPAKPTETSQPAASDETPDPPEVKTQEQPAASAEHAIATVAD